MQYVQRKLQRSVTEMRRSWMGLPSVSLISMFGQLSPLDAKQTLGRLGHDL